MAGSPVLASSINFWIEKLRSRERPLALLAAGCLLIACGVTATQTIRGATYIPRERFNALTATIGSSEGVAYWRPIWAAESIRSMESNIETHARQASVLSWAFDSRSFEVEFGQEQEARLRTFYYPHWVASSNGIQLSTRPDDDGALLVSIPSDRVKVDLQFREPARTGVAAVVTLVAWILIGSIALGGPFTRMIGRSKVRDSQSTLDQGSTDAVCS
jgi:hypothetical protein